MVEISNDFSTIFEVSNENSLFDTELASAKSIALYTMYIPSQICLDDYLAEVKHGRNVILNPPMNENNSPVEGSLIILNQDLEQSPEPHLFDAAAILISDPVDFLISKFLSVMQENVRHYPDPKESPTPFKNFEDIFCGRFETFIESSDDCNFLTRNFAGIQENDGRIPSRDDFDLAVQHLDKFKFVGISEKLASSIFILFDKLGWSSAPCFSAAKYIKPLLVDWSLTDLSHSVQDRVRELTKLDQELYKIYREKLEEIEHEAKFTSAFDEFRRQPFFISNYELRQSYSEKLANLDAVVQKYEDLISLKDRIIAAWESKYTSSQGAYTNLLKEHLKQTGVIE